MKEINLFWIFMAVMMVVSQFALADGSSTNSTDEKAEAPYRLIEGKQYEICNTLLPFINTMPHGTLREQPELLEKVKDFKLPDWKPADDKKYIDFFIRYFESLFPQEFSKKKYSENYERISGDISKGRLRFLTSRVDIDNTEKPRNLLIVQSIENGNKSGGSDTFSYVVNGESELAVDKQYSARLVGDLIYFKGRTFTVSEGWMAGDFNAWKLLIAEPHYVENWPSKFSPHSILICTFVAK